MPDQPLLAAEVTGMARKWQTHYRPSRWMLLGQTLALAGLAIFLSMCVLWSQLLHPMIFDSTLSFTAVVDAQDQAAQSPSYTAFLNDLGAAETQLQAQYTLQSLYVWNVTNPQQVLQQGFKPEMHQVGPFGFVKKSAKYNVQFSADDGSATVSYRQWEYLDPVTNASACRPMHFRMGKANLDIGQLDCANSSNSTCDCTPWSSAYDSSQKVTVVNAPLMRLLHEESPQALLAAFAQEAFASIQAELLTSFVTSVKSAFVPQRVDAAWRYRRATATAALLDRLLTQISASSSAAAARDAFAAPGTLDASVNCSGYAVPGHPTCPWGVGAYISSAAVALGQPSSTALTSTEAEHQLGMRAVKTGAITDAAAGVPLWVAAGRSIGLTALSPTYAWPTRAAGEQADAVLVTALVTELCSWEPAETGTRIFLQTIYLVGHAPALHSRGTAW